MAEKKPRLPQEITLHLFPKQEPYRLVRGRDLSGRLMNIWRIENRWMILHTPTLQYEPRRKKWHFSISHKNIDYESGWHTRIDDAINEAITQMQADLKRELKEVASACRVIERQLKKPETAIVFSTKAPNDS